MTLFKRLHDIAVAARNLVALGYHPELHYMRGPGPACARKSAHGSLTAG